MGTRAQAQALLDQLAGRVEALGLKLKAEKTVVTHLDEGFVFLGQKISGRTKHGKHLVYTFVTNEASASIKRKVKALTGRSTTNLALSELIAALNPVLRGWVNHYRHAAAKRTFGYLDYYVWRRVGRWLCKKHPRMTWKQIKRRYITEDHTYQDRGLTLYAPARARVTRCGEETTGRKAGTGASPPTQPSSRAALCTCSCRTRDLYLFPGTAVAASHQKRPRAGHPT
jgi:RNA-directed DNA polymerase